MQTLEILIPVASIIIGLFYALYTHVSNTGRHPEKKDLVFKEVCEPKMKGLSDCAEREIKALKELMTQRFDNLEKLVRNGGNPKIRT